MNNFCFTSLIRRTVTLIVMMADFSLINCLIWFSRWIIFSFSFTSLIRRTITLISVQSQYRCFSHYIYSSVAQRQLLCCCHVTVPVFLVLLPAHLLPPRFGTDFSFSVLLTHEILYLMPNSYAAVTSQYQLSSLMLANLFPLRINLRLFSFITI